MLGKLPAPVRISQPTSSEEIGPAYDVRTGDYYLWAKFTRYVLKDDCLQPAPGAQLEFYDPWALFEPNMGRQRLSKPPYVSLMNLVNRLTFSPTPYEHFQPTPDTAARVLEWCHQFGLLGVLPALSDTVVLPAQMPKGGTNPLGSQQRVMTRLAGYWNVSLTQVHEKGRAPGIRVWHWEDPGWRDEDLRVSFYPFFPTIPVAEKPQRNYPPPGCDEFWPLYGEPLGRFCRWAVRLSEALQILSNANMTLKGTASDQVERAVACVSSLAGFIQRPFAADPKTHRLVRLPYSPSLLCTFAEMALQDLEIGHRIRACAVCDEYFVARGAESVYCSPRCRNTAQRRRDRKRT